MNSENTKLPEIVFIIRFPDGRFFSLLDSLTENDFEAMVFLTRPDAERNLALLSYPVGGVVCGVPLDEHKCPVYVPPPEFVLVRAITSQDASTRTYPYLFIAHGGNRTSNIDEAHTFSSVNAAYLAKEDYQFSAGYYVAEKGKLDEVAPRKL